MNISLNQENTNYFASVIQCLGRYHGTINFNVQSQLIRFYGYDNETDSVALFVKFHSSFFHRFKVIQSFPKDFTIENPKHLEAAFLGLKYVDKMEMWVRRDSEDENHFFLMIEQTSNLGLKKTFRLSIDKVQQSIPNQVEQYWMRFRATPDLLRQHLDKLQSKAIWVQFSYLYKDYLMIGSDVYDKDEESLITSTVIHFSELSSITFAPGIDTFQEAKDITPEDERQIRRLLQSQPQNIGSATSTPQASNAPQKKKIQVSVRQAHLKPFLALCSRLKSDLVVNLTPTVVYLDGTHALFESVMPNGLVECTLYTMARDYPEDASEEPRPDPLSQKTSSLPSLQQEPSISSSVSSMNQMNIHQLKRKVNMSSTSSLKDWSTGRYDGVDEGMAEDEEDDFDYGDYERVVASPSPTRSESDSYHD